MEKLTLSETYMVLFYYAAGKHADICQPQNSAGIVLGGISGLLQSGCVREEKNGRLAVYKPLPSEYRGLEEMYTNITRHSKTALKWLDYYCCSPSTKNIKFLVANLQETLSQKHMLKVQIKKGIFRQKREVRLCEKEAEEVVRAFREAVNRNNADERTAFLVQMHSGRFYEEEKRGADGGKSAASQEISYNQGVGSVIKLLKEISQEQWNSKGYDFFPDRILCHKC